jgi:apolipoprotein N-acyltransferase
VAGVVATAVASGIAARVVAPWHLLFWVALVPWLLTLDRVTTWRGALGSGVLMAAAFSAVVFPWFPVAMADYAGLPLVAAAAIGLGVTPLFQPQLVVFALVRHAARRRGLGALRVAVTGASAYVGAEWAVPKLLGDTLGIGLWASPWLRQAADVAGPPGLTLVIVLVNEAVRASVAALVARRPARTVLVPLAAAGGLVAVLAAYGVHRLAVLAAVPAEPPVTVGIVQANVAHYDRLAAEVGTYEAVRRILDAHLGISEEVLDRGRVDLLVWPETVYPTTFGSPKSEDGAAFDRVLAGFVVATRRPLVFGSYDADGGREYNAAVFLEPDGRGGVTFDTYRKATLFPLTERVPAWLDGPSLRRRLPWLGSWQPGTGAAVVDVALGPGPDARRVRVAPLICYDAVDPRNAARAVRQGAEMLVTLSNDSWLADGAGAWLHFLVSAFRSIETRRPQVRATTTGISAVVTPTGEVVTSAAVHDRSGLVATVSPVRGPVPLAARWGDWLGPVALGVAAVLLVLG